MHKSIGYRFINDAKYAHYSTFKFLILDFGEFSDNKH